MGVVKSDCTVKTPATCAHSHRKGMIGVIMHWNLGPVIVRKKTRSIAMGSENNLADREMRPRKTR